MPGAIWHDRDEEFAAANQLLAEREAVGARLIRFDPEMAAHALLEERDNLMIQVIELRFSRWVLFVAALMGWFVAAWLGLR